MMRDSIISPRGCALVCDEFTRTNWSVSRVKTKAFWSGLILFPVLDCNVGVPEEVIATTCVGFPFVGTDIAPTGGVYGEMHYVVFTFAKSDSFRFRTKRWCSWNFSCSFRLSFRFRLS